MNKVRAVAAIIVALVGLVACGHKKTAAPPTTTTSTTEVAISIPPVSIEAATTTTVAAASTTTSTSTTVAATTTTSVTGGLAVCTDSALSLTATTNHPSYAGGETVAVTMSFRNQSSALCQISRVAAVSIVDPAGAVVHQQQYGDSFHGTTGQIKPNQTFTLTFEWDQLGCSTPAAQCPVGGNYVAEVALGGLMARAVFALA